MIRHFAFACAALVALAATASAQTSPFPFWEGGALIDSVSAACNSGGGRVSVGQFYKSTYRAKTGISGEPGNPGITLMDLRSDQAFFRTSGGDVNTMHGAGNCGGYIIKPNVTTVPNPSAPAPFACKYSLAVSPTTITADTQTVTVDGWINNWRGVPNCKVTFRAAYRLNNFP